MQEAENTSAPKVAVATGDQIELCYAVRKAVFQEEQQVPESLERDAQDATAVHMLHCLANSGEPVGASRLLISADGTVGKIGRVCVLKQHRCRGIGRAVVIGSVEELRCDLWLLFAVRLCSMFSLITFGPIHFGF